MLGEAVVPGALEAGAVVSGEGLATDPGAVVLASTPARFNGMPLFPFEEVEFC